MCRRKYLSSDYITPSSYYSIKCVSLKKSGPIVFVLYAESALVMIQIGYTECVMINPFNCLLLLCSCSLATVVAISCTECLKLVLKRCHPMYQCSGNHAITNTLTLTVQTECGHLLSQTCSQEMSSNAPMQY